MRKEIVGLLSNVLIACIIGFVFAHGHTAIAFGAALYLVLTAFDRIIWRLDK